MRGFNPLKNGNLNTGRVVLLALLALLVGLGLATLPTDAKPDHNYLAKKLKLSPAPKAKPPEAEPPKPRPEPIQTSLYGLVMEIENTEPHTSSQFFKPIQQKETLQKVTVRLEVSPKKLGLKSNLIVVDNILGDNPAYNIPLTPGARVLLNAEKESDSAPWRFYIANRNRVPALMILGALTVLAILLIGGQEVAKHAVLVTIMLMGCYKALFPAILAGTTGPYWIFLMCAMFTILGTFIYQQPGSRAFSREQSVVILSTLGGLLILTAILQILHVIMPLDGYSSEALASLWYRSPKMDYWTFFMAGMLFSFQGFLFYLCWTLSQNRKDSAPLNFWQQFDLVMLRGRRMMGPLISSLGLLFLGLFMPILLQMDGTPTPQFVNLESTCAMLTMAFAGGLTLMLTIPLTALIAAWRLCKPKTATH